MRSRATLRPLGGWGCRRWAQFSVHRHCQWLWLQLLHSVTVDVAKDVGGGWSVYFLYGTFKYCQVLWEFICSDMYNKINGFVKPEQAFPLKEEQPLRGGETHGAFHLKMLPVFSPGLLCLETFFYLRN